MKIKKLLILICVAVCFASCSEYSKLTKSTDADLKFNKAQEYFLKKKYLESASLLESVIVPFRGTEKGEKALYLLACSHYENKDYISARSYFSGYCRSYPRGQYAEDAKFHEAMCYYKDSPDVKLDQVGTRKAIDLFTAYIEQYPNSSNVPDAQSYKQELLDKLAYKAYLNARLYYRLGNYQGNNYKACVVAATNALKEFPESVYREELAFLILKAKYSEASESVAAKEEDRYRDTIEEYYSFIQEYPESEHKKEAEDIFKTSKKKIKNN